MGAWQEGGERLDGSVTAGQLCPSKDSKGGCRETPTLRPHRLHRSLQGLLSREEPRPGGAMAIFQLTVLKPVSRGQGLGNDCLLGTAFCKLKLKNNSLKRKLCLAMCVSRKNVCENRVSFGTEGMRSGKVTCERTIIPGWFMNPRNNKRKWPGDISSQV